MEKENLKYKSNSVNYALSQFFESAGFYGLRSIILLYLMSETINMEKMQAITIYSWFGISLIVSQIIGALLGDLVIGNKKVIILGGMLQSLGAFCFCIPSIIGVYCGLFFVMLGSGFYRPNISSVFGKSYFDRTKRLDSGFGIFYLATSIGTFLGIYIIMNLQDYFGYVWSFFGAGILALCSIFPVLISKENYQSKALENPKYFNNSSIKIVVVLFLVGIFWGAYELGNMHFFYLQENLTKLSAASFNNGILKNLNSIMIIPIGIITVVLWSSYIFSSTLKLIIGFILMTISYVLLIFIPEFSIQNQLIGYIAAMVFLSISEIHIAPVINSIITKYSNPKYLAITFCLSLLIIRFVSGLYTKICQNLINYETVEIAFSSVIIAIISVSIIIYSIKKYGSK